MCNLNFSLVAVVLSALPLFIKLQVTQHFMPGIKYCLCTLTYHIKVNSQWMVLKLFNIFNCYTCIC